MVTIEAFIPYRIRTMMGRVKRKSKPYWADIKSRVKNRIDSEVASTTKTNKAEAIFMCFKPIESVAKRKAVNPIVK